MFFWSLAFLPRGNFVQALALLRVFDAVSTTGVRPLQQAPSRSISSIIDPTKGATAYDSTATSDSRTALP
jgi:hypothetical protein